MDRADFAKRQAAMTETWYNNVKAQYSDVEAYIQLRHEAYLGRWKEASRFITPNSRVLDIGGGNLFPRLLEHINSLSLDYHYIDVDPSAVESSSILAANHGIDPTNFMVGYNDCLDYPTAYFDSVFSSHCIEHSIDLSKTLLELNRILKPSGFLMMAVPLGWEENPEHPYFFTPDQWTALLEDAGFEIRVSQLGREYPESGHDLFIGAKKISSGLRKKRLNPLNHMKTQYNFVGANHPSVAVRPQRIFPLKKVRSGPLHLLGHDWTISVTLEADTSRFLPVFVHHSWSAQIQIEGIRSRSIHDLFSSFHYVQPCFHHENLKSGSTVTITPLAKNISSWSTEGCLLGYLVDK